jgi:hypothetical protein
MSILIAPTGARANTNLSVKDLRAEVAKHLRKQNLILKISFDPTDPARMTLIAKNPEVKQIDVDVTNLSERLRGLPAERREAEIQRFIRLILKWATSSSPSGN